MNFFRTLYIELVKAHDRLDRYVFPQELEIYAIWRKVLNCMKNFYEQKSIYIIVTKRVTSCFRVNIWLGQEYAMLSRFFVI